MNCYIGGAEELTTFTNLRMGYSCPETVQGTSIFRDILISISSMNL